MITIIAEIGQNHGGNMQSARDMIYGAKANGADLVKLQLYDSLNLYGEHQLAELTQMQAQELFDYGKGVGIEVFFSVFDLTRVLWCEQMGVERYKIANSERHNNKLIKAVCETKKPMFVSIGLHKRLPDIPTKARVDFLYCVARYPAPLDEVYLGKVNFNLYSGYSDHTIGLDACMVALSRGAKIIEKHFTQDKELKGADHQWSMDGPDLYRLRKFANNLEEML